MAIFSAAALVATASAGDPATAPRAPGTDDSGSGITDVSPGDAFGDALRPCLCHGAFAGSDEPFTFDLTVGYDSSYLCRGLDVGDDAFHGTATFDIRPVEWLTWTSSLRYQDVTDVDFEEYQIYTGVFFEIGNLTVGPSFRWYQFRPDGNEIDAYDLGVQALYKLGPVNFSGGYYYETESEGSYVEAGVSTTVPVVADRLSLVPTAQISYTDGWLMPHLSGFNVLDLRLHAPLKITENLRIAPYIGAQIPLEALDDTQNDKLIGGVALSFTFK